MLLVGSTVHALVVDGTPRCRAFHVEGDPEVPSQRRLVHRRVLGHDETEISATFRWADGTISFTEAAREVVRTPSSGGTARESVASESTTCTASSAVDASAEGVLRLGGAAWFARASDCDAALASGQRVAFGDCLLPLDRPDEDAQAAGIARFEQILATGGSFHYLTTDDDDVPSCETWRVAPRRRGRPQGELRRRVRDGAMTVTTIYGYSLEHRAANRLTMPTSTINDGETPAAERQDPPPLYPELITTGPSTEVRGGPDGDFGHGYGCGEVTMVLPIDRDAVEVDGPTYLSLAACRRALELERTAGRFYPVGPDAEEGSLALGLGSSGPPGC